MAELAEIVTKTRKEKHLSQHELAEQAGVSQSAINFIERGKTSSPNPSTIDNIARVLELDPERLKVLAGIRTPDAVPMTPEEERIQELARTLVHLPTEIHELIARASADPKALRMLQLLSLLSRLPAEDQSFIVAEVLARVRTRTEPEPSPNAE